MKLNKRTIKVTINVFEKDGIEFELVIDVFQMTSSVFEAIGKNVNSAWSRAWKSMLVFTISLKSPAYVTLPVMVTSASHDCCRLENEAKKFADGVVFPHIPVTFNVVCLLIWPL